MALGSLDITDNSGAGKAAATDSLFTKLGVESFDTGNQSANANLALPEVSIGGTPTEIQTIEPYFMNIEGMDFGSAEQFAEKGIEPDYIIGEDGKIRQNPNKAEISSDGKLHIQVDGKDVNSLKAANEAQKASIRELIRYFQKYNPGKQIPQEWTDKLHAQPDIPQGDNSKPEYKNPYIDNSPVPTTTGGGRRSGGGYRGGGGTRSSGGGRRASYDSAPTGRDFRPEPIGPRGNIERHKPIEGDMKLKGPPTITPEKINEVLKSYGSPATGLGQLIYDEGVRTGINPAVALAFFIQESSAGTAGVARTTKSFGNIKGSGRNSYKGFKAYDSWEDGVKDWYRLINDKYLAPKSEGGRGYEYLSQVIHTYAPKSDNNDEVAYVANVKGMVAGWKNSSGDGRVYA